MKKHDIKYVTKWIPPEGDDLRPLIAMPNIPKALHGLAPRTLLGASTWDKMRKACYEAANDTCEICGDKPEKKQHRHSHEVYEIDYERGVSTFKRCFCLCALDHLACIHTGRAITLYKQGSPLYPKEFVLEGVEKAFAIISSYNHDHPEADLRAYHTFLAYLKVASIQQEVEALIEKYNMKFYAEDPKRTAEWGKWKLVIGNKEYPTPYANEKEWKEAMEKKNETDSARLAQREVEKHFSADVYNEINNIIKETNDENN